MHDLNSRLIPFGQRTIMEGQPIRQNEISIIIPVKEQQVEISNFLDSFFLTHGKNDFPLEILIVDNNSTPPIVVPEQFLHKDIPIFLYQCKTKGAAAARNIGVENARGKWMLFTDSDCIATETFLSGYLGLNPKCVAYSGNVVSHGDSPLDQYYDSQEILIPPKATYGELAGVPMYIVTANAIVFRDAYLLIGGFNEEYPVAGGEDEDFTMRLWQSGNIGYAPDSLIRHDYRNGIKGFIKRFVNYGRGAFITEKAWNTRKKPKLFSPKVKTPLNRMLAYFQFFLMLYGYWYEKVTSNG